MPHNKVRNDKERLYKKELEDHQVAILDVLENNTTDAEDIRLSRRAILNVLEDLEVNNAILEQKTIELEQSEQNILHTKAISDAILESIGDGLVVVDKEGRITYVNQAFERMVGWKAEEVLGKSIIEVIPRESEKGEIVEFNERILTKVLSGEIVIADLTNPFYYIRKDGSRFPTSSIVTPIILDGEIIGVVETFRDITKEKEIDKAKTEFVSLASHQLRTPLSTINWYTEMLLAGDVGKLNSDQEKYLDEVYRGNQRMVGLVNALLSVSRMDLGTFVLEPEPTDVTALVRGVVNEQKPQIDQKKISLFPLFGTNIPLIQTDPKLFRIVIQNLLSNAIKYTPEKGTIELSLDLINKKKTLLFKITDTGYGIPQNQQDKIFTKLFRADNVREKDTEGTGLGLYMVKSIIDNSKGKVWFESTENKGTTFNVELPVNF
ncbi:MAG: Signal transduction histidine kinase [Candidatus Taylorbacteria bacterium]|nr:Signal transduction histidine kinase [Candidatus Taylorbacteria bacterium]